MNRKLSSHAVLWSPPLLILVVDLVLRQENMSNWILYQWLVYMFSAGLGLSGWLLMIFGFQRMVSVDKKVARITIGSGTLIISSWYIISLAVLQELKNFPSWSDVAYLLEQPASDTWSLVQAEYTLPGMIAIVGLTLLLAPILQFLANQDTLYIFRKKVMRLVFVGIFACALLVRITIPHMSEAVTPGINFFVCAGEVSGYFMSREKAKLHVPRRLAVPDLGTPGSPLLNVLIIVNESLSRKYLDLYSDSSPTEPFLSRWRQEYPQNIYVFSKGTTNSSNTGIAVPVIFTGLSPAASAEEFHAVPLLWDYAKAADYHTFLFSAQNYQWGNLDDFLLTSNPPDFFFTADPGKGVEITNGGGMDDTVLMDRIQKYLNREIPQPFIGVIQLNATHYPFNVLARDDGQQFADSRLGRYQRAIALLDNLMEELWALLVENGLQANTAIFFTSDHGESMNERKVHRTQSYYEEIIGIPILIYLPSTFQQQHPEKIQRLRRNTDFRVQNLDIVPTVLDVLSLNDKPELASFKRFLVGQSWFSWLDPDRIAIIMNNNALRQWNNEGFGLMRGDTKYIFSQRFGEELYDISQDPDELNNLWTGSPKDPAWIKDTIQRNSQLQAIRTRHCSRLASCQAEEKITAATRTPR